jgi:hypothetical protein
MPVVLFEVGRAIDFDHESRPKARKVGEVWTDRMLPPEASA